ncbi:MAG: ABC transporter ATP-binding protein [Rhodoblastus sp.]
MTASLLSVRGLEAWYGAAQILFSVDLELREGEVVALMGRNGAGKTTTIEAIIGLVSQRAGSVLFREKELIGLRPHEIARLGIGFVPEDRRIFTDLTVLENLEVGRRAQAQEASSKTQAWTPERLFQLFPNLAEARNRAAGQMSGGEQQMLTVARTLMGNPVAILLDEPSEGIAPIIVESMMDMIAELKSSGVSIIVSEQNIQFAAAVADRAYVIDHGQIKFSGEMADLMKNAEVRRTYLEL